MPRTQHGKDTFDLDALMKARDADAANLPEVKQELHDSLDAALESLMNTYPKPSLTIVKRK